MRVRRTLVRGSVVIVAATGVSLVFGLLRSVVVARLLDDPDLIGLLSILATLNGIFSIVAAFGVPTAMARYFGQLSGGNVDVARRLIPAGLAFGIGMAALTGASMFALSWPLALRLYGRPELVSLFQVGAFSVAASAIQGSLAGGLRGLQSMPTLGGLSILESSVALAAAFVFVTSFGLIGAALAILAASLGSLAAAAVLLVRRAKRSNIHLLAKPGRGSVREVVRYSLPLFASGLIFLPALWIAETALALRASFADLGLYRLGYGFYNLLLTLPGVLAVPLMPLLAAMGEKEPARVNDVFSRIVRVMIVVVLPIAILVSLGSKVLLGVLYGDTYVPAHAVTSVVVLSSLFLALSPVTSSLLTGSGRTLAVLALDSFWAAAFVPTALVLIQFGGVLGLGYAHLIGAAALFGFQLFYVHRKLSLSLRPFVVPAAASLAGLTTTLTLLSLLVPDDRALVAIPVSLVFAAVGLLILRPEEREMILAAVRDVIAPAREA